MKDIAKLGATLCIISSIAACALGVTDKITAPKIAQISAKSNDEARQLVLPNAKSFEKLEGKEEGIVTEVYKGVDGSNTVGYTIKTTPSGYGGPVEVIVGINADGKINKINIGNHTETPGLGSKAAEPKFKDQYNEKSTQKELEVVKGKKSNDNQIEAISGATITSTAVTKGVNAAIEVFNKISK